MRKYVPAGVFAGTRTDVVPVEVVPAASAGIDRDPASARSLPLFSASIERKYFVVDAPAVEPPRFMTVSVTAKSAPRRIVAGGFDTALSTRSAGVAAGGGGGGSGGAPLAPSSAPMSA